MANTTRLAMLTVMVHGLATLSACAERHPIGSTDRVVAPHPIVAVRWMPSCKPGDGPASFGIAAYANDEIVFTGGPRTREAGSVRLQFTGGAQEVTKIVRSALRASRRARGSEEDRGFCIEVDRPAGSRVSTLRIESSSVAGVALRKALSAKLPVQKWACPVRPAVATRRQPIAPFCDEQVAQPAIIATYQEPVSCESYHLLEVYRDGTIYYGLMAAGYAPDLTRTDHFIAENYYSISSGAVARLIDLVATFDVRQDDLSILCWRDDHAETCGLDTSSFKSTHPEELARFRRAVDAEAPIAWGTLPKARGSCAVESKIFFGYALAVK